jgi:hypothetical protein
LAACADPASTENASLFSSTLTDLRNENASRIIEFTLGFPKLGRNKIFHVTFKSR